MNTKIDFITGNTRKCLLTMAIPMIAAMFLNMAYNIVDSLWIGNMLGETAMASLTVATPIIMILSAIAMGATNGVTILLSQALGAKDTKKTESIIATSFIISIIFSVLLTLLIEIGLTSILNLLNTPKETFSLAYDYLYVYLLGYIAVYLYCYFTAVLRSFGDTSFQAIAMLLCVILNGVLAPVFIHIIGFKGAAIATLLSQVIALVIMLIYLKKKNLFILHCAKFDSKIIIPIVKTAIPSIIQQSIPAISTSFLTSLITGFGVTAIAGYGVAGKLEIILMYPTMALNMVLTTIVGHCSGAERYDRLKDYMKTTLLYGVCLLVIISVFVTLFSKQLSGLFLQSDGVASIVSQYFLIVSVGYIMNAISNSFLGAINGMGYATKSMVIMIVYYVVIRMPLAFILSKTRLGLSGIWVSVLISLVVAGISAAVSGNLLILKQERKLKQALSGVEHA